MQIKIRRGEQEFGPYSLAEAREYYATGRIIDTDWAQYEGATNWVSVREIPGLRDTISEWPKPVLPPEEDSWGRVARDVAIVFGLTLIGGFIVGVTSRMAAPPEHRKAYLLVGVIISNLVLGTLGFVISGCGARGPRWNHLARVAIGLWLLGLVNVFIMHVPFASWIMTIFLIFIMMGIGGGISLLIKRSK